MFHSSFHPNSSRTKIHLALRSFISKNKVNFHIFTPESTNKLIISEYGIFEAAIHLLLETGLAMNNGSNK